MALSSKPGYGWEKYYTLREVYAWLDEMLSKYPTLLTHYKYGKSYEGRQLRALKVSHKKVGKFKQNQQHRSDDFF